MLRSQRKPHGRKAEKPWGETDFLLGTFLPVEVNFKKLTESETKKMHSFGYKEILKSCTVYYNTYFP